MCSYWEELGSMFSPHSRRRNINKVDSSHLFDPALCPRETQFIFPYLILISLMRIAELVLCRNPHNPFLSSPIFWTPEQHEEHVCLLSEWGWNVLLRWSFDIHFSFHFWFLSLKDKRRIWRNALTLGIERHVMSSCRRSLHQWAWVCSSHLEEGSSCSWDFPNAGEVELSVTMFTSSASWSFGYLGLCSGTPWSKWLWPWA